MISRADGALVSTALVAAAIGAAVAGRLLHGGDLGRILMAFGVVDAIVSVGGSLRLWSAERSIPRPDAALVAEGEVGNEFSSMRSGEQRRVSARRSTWRRSIAVQQRPDERTH